MLETIATLKQELVDAKQALVVVSLQRIRVSSCSTPA